MALLFVDSCDCYAATADLIKRWSLNTNTTNVTYDATGGKQGTGAIKFVTSGSLARLITLGNTKIRMAFWLKVSAAPGSANRFIALYNAAATAYGSIHLQATGVLTGNQWDTSSPATYATGIRTVGDNTWHFVEIEMLNADSGGVLKVWIDGVFDINFSGDSKMASAAVDYNSVYVYALSGITSTIDDVAIWDDTGTELTGPIGSYVIETLRPIADTAQKDFTRSAGADNYALVDEAAPNDDADYVYSTTVGHEDLYDVGNLSAGVTSVKAVCSVIVAKNDQGGSINLKHSAKSGSTTGRSAAQAVPSAYAPMFYAFAKNPATAAAWTSSEVNGAQFGFQVA